MRILDQYLDIVEPHLDRIMERMDRIEPHLPYILLHLAPWDTGFRRYGWAGNPVDFFGGTQKNGHYGTDKSEMEVLVLGCFFLLFLRGVRGEKVRFHDASDEILDQNHEQVIFAGQDRNDVLLDFIPPWNWNR